jgi:hypothetical protein
MRGRRAGKNWNPVAWKPDPDTPLWSLLPNDRISTRWTLMTSMFGFP